MQAHAGFHLQLNRFNAQRFTPRLPTDDWHAGLEEELVARANEIRFVEEERANVVDRARKAPRNAREFIEWFENLKAIGPGQGDILFPWLAEEATIREMKWFLGQEVAGEAGFDDLLALAQIKLPPQAKLELARNYWDELGRGTASGMHGPMLAHLASSMRVGEDPAVWESIALGNLMIALAANRRYAYHAIGALGVIELTAPGRAAFVNAGLKRLGVDGEVRRYYALHATLDIKHSEAWNKEALMPLVEEDPERAQAFAEGALMRLEAGHRCFIRYRQELRAPALPERFEYCEAAE
ncbi:MAG: iron-containing redox enzyme family protein [Sandaracinaceae bacterium]|nr:iron-containing redox enzyme family protein [Sandaracinaceae bacterium]